MLSVCIPVYNYHVRPLVETLHAQLVRSRIDAFEILLIDDASQPEYQEVNRTISLPFVRYRELEVNIGRSRIRNLLAQQANYPYLLFIDCDSAVVDDRYIARYLPYCQPETMVYGGRLYAPEPAGEEYYLRWIYGIVRESGSANWRSQQPNHRFASNNFLIDRQLFEQVTFDESLTGYGHEDTFFALELLAKEIIIRHIDNPLVHIGLEDAPHFLQQTENSIANLMIVEKMLQERYPQYVNHSRLMQTYRRLERRHLRKLSAGAFKLLRPLLKRYLLGKHPRLYFFDIYKLGLLIQNDIPVSDQE